MKKIYIISILFVSILILFLFYPRNIKMCVFIESSNKNTQIYYKGKIKTINGHISYPKYSVLDISYNFFKINHVKINSPLVERIMMKNNNSYELEMTGNVNLNKKPYYYSIDGDISKTDETHIIIGNYSTYSYLDKKGDLAVFIIYPFQFTDMRIGLSNENYKSFYHQNENIILEEDGYLYSYLNNVYININKGSNILIEKQKELLNVTINNKNYYFKNRFYIKSNNIKINSIKRNYDYIPKYNGVLEFSNNKKGFLMINETTIEDYLKKVVPSEMFATSPLESLKCQAIAARTYAISDALKSRYAYVGFFVDDSTFSQVYNNSPETEKVNQAISSTEGIIMTYKNKPIDAKYYSCSCGFGASFSDIWFNPDFSSTSNPYLSNTSYSDEDFPKEEESWLSFYKSSNIKAYDSDSPYFRWNLEYTSLDLTDIINKSIEELLTFKKDYVLIKNKSKLKSKFKKFKNIDSIDIIKRGKSGNVEEISIKDKDYSVTIISDSAIRYCFKCTDIPIYLKNNKIFKFSSLPSSFFSIENKNNKFVFYGGGFGHGVGMSQYGAINLGEKGLTADEILNIYYKNIEFTNINTMTN
ncbi:MAG: SpoIID/LytB domain-containing protein [Clostridiaceae bacterium]